MAAPCVRVCRGSRCGGGRDGSAMTPQTGSVTQSARVSIPRPRVYGSSDQMVSSSQSLCSRRCGSAKDVGDGSCAPKITKLDYQMISDRTRSQLLNRDCDFRYPRLRALQVCRRRPTLVVAAVPNGRHPQTFTRAEQDDSGPGLYFGIENGCTEGKDSPDGRASTRTARVVSSRSTRQR